MKKTIIKFLNIVIIAIAFIACEVEKEDLIVEDNSFESSISENTTFNNSNNNTRVNNTIQDCVISGDLQSPVQFIGETRTYTVSHPFNSNTPIIWSIINGSNGMQVIGSSTGDSYTIRFTASFTGGVIRVVSGNCDLRLTINVTGGGIVNDCANTVPDRPGQIDFDAFLGSKPSENADFCVNTRANILAISSVECAESYIWSITPTVFGTQLQPNPSNGLSATLKVTQPGNYVVSVRAVNANGQASQTRSISLTAEQCRGGILF